MFCAFLAAVHVQMKKAPLIHVGKDPASPTYNLLTDWTYPATCKNGLQNDAGIKVRKTPILLPLYSHRNAQANLHLLGQPDTLLAQVPLGVAGLPHRLPLHEPLRPPRRRAEQPRRAPPPRDPDPQKPSSGPNEYIRL